MNRLYVLTRNDLGLAYQAVQGAHAVAQFMMEYPGHEWKNGYLIFLAVENQAELEEWYFKFLVENADRPKFTNPIAFTKFNESDLNDEMTSIAIYTKGSRFKKLSMMQPTVAEFSYGSNDGGTMIN